ncbi:LysR family transcriptional regulator [Acetobacter malorum]|uniref:LysR family transcriptional regulator n=1 Tax=Acetobacter malorum TaxID=178901 RepID=UPI000776E199|nr:LysR family transcriptional regulator [Acetobacter malorum]KXV05502.1 transcriptional regulator [Acetobacter malorum]
MRTANLKYFKLAVEAGIFTHAARIHGVKASTVTRAVDKLEDELGVTLFERNRNGIRLTPAGEILSEKIFLLLRQVDDIRTSGKRLGSGDRKAIRIGSLLPPISSKFRLALSTWKKRHPRIRIIIYEMGSQDLRMALFQRRVDAVFSIPCDKDDGIQCLPFYNENLVVALPENHTLCSRSYVSHEDLRNETFLVQDWGNDNSIKDYYLKILGFDTRIEKHPAGKQSVFALVGAGFGLTLASQSQAECGFPGVAFRQLSGGKILLPVHLGWNSECLDALTGRFIAFVRDLTRRD